MTKFNKKTSIVSKEDQTKLSNTLKICAERSQNFGNIGASEKQCWFLAGLILGSRSYAETGDALFDITTQKDIDNGGTTLSMSKASSIISEYLGK